MIAAEGEMNASRKLKEAADVMSESPNSMQLRYLQTLTAISAEKNSTIIFPLPIDMINALTKKWALAPRIVWWATLLHSIASVSFLILYLL